MLKFRLAIILPTLASIVIGYIWYMKKKQRNGEPSWPSNEESQKADDDLISDDDVSEASNVNDDNNIPLECNPLNLVREFINSTASNPNGVGNEIGNDVNADEIINDDDDDDGVDNGSDILESHFQSPLSSNHHHDDNSKHESNDNAENKIGETIEQEDDSKVMQIILEENRNNHIEPLLETEEQHINTETITQANTQTDKQSIPEILPTTCESMSNTNSNDMHADTHVRHVQKTSLCNVETDDVSTISANTHGIETSTHGVETTLQALREQCEQSDHLIKQQHEHSESVVEGEELHRPQHRLDRDEQQHQSTEHHHLWSDIIDEDSTISPIETYFNNADNNNNTDTTSTLTPLWQSNCPPNDYATAATTTTTNAKNNKESVRRTRSSRHKNKNKNNTINNNDSYNDRRSKSKPDDVAKSAADDSNNQHGGRDHHHHHNRHQEDDKYIHFRKNRPSSGNGNNRKKFAGADGFNDFNWRSTNMKPTVDQSLSGSLRGCNDENANTYRDGLAAEASHTGNANMNSDENFRNGDEVFAEEGLDHQIRTTSESDGMLLSTSAATSSATAAATEAATAVCEDTSIETYKFEFPGDLCGLLIGRKGRTVNAIGSESNTSIFVDRRSESASAGGASDKQIVIINGTKKCIKMALKLLKERFPPKKFPEINFDVCIVDDPLPASASPMFFTSDAFQQLELPSSEMFPGMVANIVSAHHLFIHLPFHQSFQLLPMLSSYIYSCYSRLAGNSMNLPHPIMREWVTSLYILILYEFRVGELFCPYTFCICGINGGWYRSLVTQVLNNRKDGASYNNDEDGNGDDDDLTYIVRFVDYGGYEQVKASDLFLIRNDFMDLPFQAVECYLANVYPPLGMNGYPEESARRLEELTRDVQLCVSVVGVADNGVPCIQLFKSVDDMMLLDVAQDLLELNLISTCPPQPRNIISLAEITALSATSTTNTTTTSSTHLPHSNDVVFNDFAPSNAVGMGLATDAVGMGLATDAVGMGLATSAVGMGLATNAVGMGLAPNAVGMYNNGVVGVSDDRYIDEAIRRANMVYDMVSMADDDGAAYEEPDHRSSQ
ncbi:hypothetical protein HELRODRAFT_192509 [Helobdella robusta]|uniref:Tudor domain-containing protein n=1 Tax=Helobdella robusta TaxID=6412 RepID=T1FU13_HELRO|nr:hypothetical protein HELRODRAFT_192509 [Helobdella robusta]ESO00974.1 hypothetical protein HELRODRAFT_192509 [Helobdella robusta]